MFSAISFRTRLTLRWTVAFAILLAAACGTVYLGSRFYAYRDIEADVRTLAATELASSTDQDRPLHLHPLPVQVLAHTQYSGKFAQIYDAQGRLLVQSGLDGGTTPTLTRAAIDRAVAGEFPVIDTVVAGKRARVAAFAVPQNGHAYVLAVGMFTAALEQDLDRLAWLLAMVWLLGCGVTAALGFGLASRALAPVVGITARAEAIARGEFAARLDPPRAQDEIGTMTRLLNRMIGRMHEVIEANRRFASDASHELRTPLTAMAGEVDLALRRERSADEYRDTLRRIRAQIADMAALTDNLMLLVRAQERPGEGSVHEVPLPELVAASLRRVAPAAAERNVSIHTGDLAALVCYGDPGLLGRVLDNLLSNAVQYNRDGGQVFVTGRFEEPSGEGWKTGHVRLAVRDTGPGIPREEWTKIFDRFYRLERSRSRRKGGAGLGLSISAAIATLFGGEVRVAESSAEGTTFELVLPGTLASSPALPAASGASHQAAQRAERDPTAVA